MKSSDRPKARRLIGAGSSPYCVFEAWPPFFKRAPNPLLSIYYDTRNVASDPAARNRAFSVALARGLSPKELASDKKSLKAQKRMFRTTTLDFCVR